MKSNLRPPLIGVLLLRARRLGPRRGEIEADLSELMKRRAASEGRLRARWRYMIDAASLWTNPAPGLDATPRVRPSLRSLAGDGLSDIRYATRMFRRQPAVFAMSIAGLAVAIGMSASSFSVVKAVGLGDRGVEAAHEVVRVVLGTGVWTRTTGRNSPMLGNWGYSDFQQLGARTHGLDLVASASGYEALRVEGVTTPNTVSVIAVSGRFFDVLRSHAAQGRLIEPADDRADAPPVAVISYGFWKHYFSGGDDIVGRTIWVSDTPMRVVGVAARGVSGPTTGSVPPALWISLAQDEALRNARLRSERSTLRSELESLAHVSSPSAEQQARRSSLTADLAPTPVPWNPAVDVVGRLKAGWSRDAASAELIALAASLAADHGVRAPSDRPLVRLAALGGADETTLLMLFLAIVGSLIVVAAANVANLLLANAATRSHEIATRLALGASRRRVVRQLVTESVTFGLVAGLLGILAALWAAPLLGTAVSVPDTVDVTPDWGVAAFAVIVASVAGMLAGLAPARYGRRGDVLGAITRDQVTSPNPLPRHRGRSILIGVQAAIAVVLLVGAALLTRSLLVAAGADLGFDPNHVLSVQTGNNTNGRTWDAARREVFWGAALPRVRELPGVDGAALASLPPFAGQGVPRLPSGLLVMRNEVTPEFFAEMGLPLRRGRTFTDDERRREAPVAIISEDLARRFWPGGDPLGSDLERVWGVESPAATARAGINRRPAATRVVGVVGTMAFGLRTVDAPTIYMPLRWSLVAHLVVRTNGPADRVARPVQEALRSVDPDAGGFVQFARDGRARDLDLLQTMALMGTLLAGSALVLSVAGLFGVTAFVIGRRRHELAVRATLGASRVTLMRMLLRDAMRPVVIGLACGLVLAVPGAAVLRVALVGIGPRDPVAIIAAVALLFGAALVAIIAPTRRAVRENPAQVLRQG